MRRFLLSSLQSTWDSCSSSVTVIMANSHMLRDCSVVRYLSTLASTLLMMNVNRLYRMKRWYFELAGYWFNNYVDLIGWWKFCFRNDPWLYHGSWGEHCCFNKVHNRKQSLLLLNSQASYRLPFQVIYEQFMCNIPSNTYWETAYSSGWVLEHIIPYLFYDLYSHGTIGR